MTQAIQLTLMTVEEARATVDQIKTNLESVRALLFELREREGWRALGYATWQACIQAEFHMSERRSYQLLNAHRVDQILAPAWQEASAFFGKNATTEPDRTMVQSAVPTAPIPERHARELEPLVAEPEAVREVYSQVVEQTNGRPTAPAIRGAVDRYLGIERPTPAYTPPSEPPPSIDELANEQDHDGAVAAARLNAQYSTGIAAAVKLTFLDARAVVGLLGRDRRLVHGENARMLRRWLDAVDSELRAAEEQPLRMVGGSRG